MYAFVIWFASFTDPRVASMADGISARDIESALEAARYVASKMDN
jgi:hypothetical protein